MMNMYALQGHVVRVTEESAKAGDEFDRKQVTKHLEIDKEYKVEFTIVHNYSSQVKLVGIEPLFNTMNFEDVDKQSEEDDEEHPQYWQYN